MHSAPIETGTAEMREDDFLIAYEVHEYRLEFRSYEVVYWEYEVGGVTHSMPTFRRHDGTGSGDDTEDIAKAQVFASGSIKWDGCMDMRFDEQEVHILHFCGREDAARLGKMFAGLFSLAIAKIPKAQPDLF